MAKKQTVSPEKTALLNAFSDFLDAFTLSGASGGSVAKSDAVAEEGGLDREAVEKLGIVELRKLAKENGIDEKKKADILAAMESADLFSDSEDSEEEDDEEEDDEDVEVDEDEDEEDEDGDEDEDEEEDDEDEEDEDDSLSREELEELSLKELRVLAKEQGHKQSDYRSLDQAALVDLLVGDEDEDDEDEEEEVEITQESLKAMSETELRSLAKDAGISIKKTDKKSAIVKKILDAVEEDEDED